ncbi:kinase-like protein [Wilcoxina mikolae CBS 423.85]|nr:kinase-like protein [Wilcoxina mikolae CBS 423.85]
MKPSDRWVRDKRELGRGGFGIVWREKIAANNAVRAVKIISKRDPRLSPERWKREVANFAALGQYPTYFVRFLGSFENEHSLSIAMEYIRYGDLSKHLKGAWKEADARPVTSQLLDGLMIMHHLGITHRDLRPENIFVASLSPMHVKIGDFGISKRIQNNDTALRTVCGTFHYTAPEILAVDDRERFEYTNAVDIWSLGCVVHQILTCQTPFTTRSEFFSLYIWKDGVSYAAARGEGHQRIRSEIHQTSDEG